MIGSLTKCIFSSLNIPCAANAFFVSSVGHVMAYKKLFDIFKLKIHQNNQINYEKSSILLILSKNMLIGF